MISRLLPPSARATPSLLKRGRETATLAPLAFSGGGLAFGAGLLGRLVADLLLLVERGVEATDVGLHGFEFSRSLGGVTRFELGLEVGQHAILADQVRSVLLAEVLGLFGDVGDEVLG